MKRSWKIEGAEGFDSPKVSVRSIVYLGVLIRKFVRNSNFFFGVFQPKSAKRHAQVQNYVHSESKSLSNTDIEAKGHLFAWLLLSRWFNPKGTKVFFIKRATSWTTKLVSKSKRPSVQHGRPGFRLAVFGLGPICRFSARRFSPRFQLNYKIFLIEKLFLESRHKGLKG